MHWSRYLRLSGNCTYLVDSILNIASDVCWKDRPSIHRLSHWLLPRPQQTFQCLTSTLIHNKIGIHECAIKIAAQVYSVWGANILNDGIEDIERRELPLWTCLLPVSHLYDWVKAGTDE